MRRTTLPLAILALVVGVAIPSGALAAQDPAPPPEPPKAKEIPLDSLKTRHFDPAARTDPNRSLSVMVELTGDPVAVAQGVALESGTALSQGQRSSRRASLKATQDAIIPDIKRLGGRVGAQLQDAYNGIRVRIPAGQAAALAKLPGVKAVRPLKMTRADTTSSVPFIGTPAVWQSLGLTGKNIKIGVIDSGIDYYHANFAGTGNPLDYAEDDRTVIEPGTFPTFKVAGGWDFAGDNYDALSDDPARNTPAPDPDPLDCMGHGSNVAGIAAGQGVLMDKTAFRGPYNATTHERGFIVGPGVAPEATLYSLKVFGCEGFTQLDADAINWAVEHDLDVINLSLGGAFGRDTDPSSVAANNAAAAGVVVVAAAGNGGGPYSQDTPGAASGALQVAAMDTIPGFPRVNFVTESTTVLIVNANGSTALPVTGTLRLLEDDPATEANESRGCAASDYAAVQPGEIVVTRLGSCQRVDRVLLATGAGASAVVLLNSAPGQVFFEGVQSGAIPYLNAPPSAEAAIVAAAGTTVTIEEAAPTVSQTFKQMADFSSGGPRNGDSGQKPDITAPGVNIFSSAVGTGYAGLGFLGTSQATPHVAGVAALVRELRPNWTAHQVKAAIVNTGDPAPITHGNPDLPVNQYAVPRSGTGLVDPVNATATEVVATGQGTGGGLSFGLAETPGVKVATKTITLTNRGPRAATYAVSTEWDTRYGGATVAFSADTVTVPARGKATVDVTLTVNGLLAPGGDRPGSAIARQLAPAAGTILFSPTATARPPLRVSFLSVVRGTSDITTTPRTVRLADQVSFSTSATTGVFGPAEVHAWGLADVRGDALGTDLINVGVSSSSGLGVFTMHSANPTSNPSVNLWLVALQTDNDPDFDYAVVGFDLGFLVEGRFTGKDLAAITINLETETIVRAFSAFTSLNSAIVQLPFLLSDVGLSAGGQELFRYQAVVSSQEGFGDDVVSETALFNPFAAPVQTGQFFATGPGAAPTQWTATVDRAQLAITPVLGWLVLYKFNKGGVRQAETIAFR